ncbi:MAG: hypothetical protein GEV07_16915 [Streptosporangiales bacterium]|nr:hypothetical protein [Streptosporangiales bacterium]
MSVLGVNLFGLIVAFLAGVVTGGMVVFFTRGPVVAYFRVKDEPDPQPVQVEVLASRPRPCVRRQPVWERVTARPVDAVLPESTRRQLGHGGGA